MGQMSRSLNSRWNFEHLKNFESMFGEHGSEREERSPKTWGVLGEDFGNSTNLEFVNVAKIIASLVKSHLAVTPC